MSNSIVDFLDLKESSVDAVEIHVSSQQAAEMQVSSQQAADIAVSSHQAVEIAVASPHSADIAVLSQCADDNQVSSQCADDNQLSSQLADTEYDTKFKDIGFYPEATSIKDLLYQGFILFGTVDRHGGPIITFPLLKIPTRLKVGDIITCFRYLLEIVSEPCILYGLTIIIDKRDGDWQSLSAILTAIQGFLKNTRQILCIVKEEDLEEIQLSKVNLDLEQLDVKIFDMRPTALIFAVLVLSIVGFWLQTIGVATPSWLSASRFGQTSSSGLWQACWNRRCTSLASANNRFNAVRAFGILAILAGAATIAIVLVYLFVKQKTGALVAAIAVSGASAFCSMIGFAVFADLFSIISQTFGYSFGLCVAAFVVFLINTGLLVFQFIKNRQEWIELSLTERNLTCLPQQK